MLKSKAFTLLKQYLPKKPRLSSPSSVRPKSDETPAPHSLARPAGFPSSSRAPSTEALVNSAFVK